MRQVLGTLTVMLVLVLLAVLPARAERLVVGEEILEHAETPHPYALAERAEPLRVWSRTLTHPQASYVAPHFSRFQLAEGDHVIVRSPDGKQSWRYEGLGRAGQGLDPDGFWSAHIDGDTAIVELYSRRASDAWGLTLDRWARGLTSAEIGEVNGSGPSAPAAICGADDSSWAKCYQLSEPEIYEQSRAVARLLISGQFGCTGWLMGCEGHLITNAHCIGNQTEANNTDYEFMAEGASCTTSCASWFACPGAVRATQAALVQVDTPLDYSLVLLPENLSGTYGHLRLRPTGPLVGERIYVPQHPAGWGKRIAVASTHPSDESGSCEVLNLNSPSCTGGAPDVGYYCDTQGGSSGSPVVAYTDHRVVALHHCANCPNRAINITDVIADLGANLPDCAVGQFAGTLALDRNTFSCADAMTITVQDDSLEGLGRVAVTVRSDTEPTPETVLLEEETSGVFRGSVSTAGAAALASGDGELSLSHGDTITARYVDADNGAGGVSVVVEAMATADCQGPTITRVDASDVTGNAATITWDTDEPADSRVLHGTSTADASLVTGHSLRITGLAECSTQSYGVVSTDAVGNATSVAGLPLVTGKNTQPELDSSDTPLAIPDNQPAGALSTITVADTRTVIDVNVRVEIAHPFDGDLTLVLITPGGMAITLAAEVGGAGDGFSGTLFDDEALTPIAAGSPPFLGPFRPQQPLSAVDGTSGAGSWRLKVVDGGAGQSGAVASWRLILTYPPQVCGAHAVYQSHAVVTDVCPAGGAGGNGTWDAGEQLQFEVAIRNDGSEPLHDVTVRVTPLAPGPLMLQDSAFYGDLALGAAASSSAPDFIVWLPGGLSCATALGWQLEIDAQEGQFTGGFVQRVGHVFEFGGLRLDERFDAGGLPFGWSLVDGANDGHTWFADDVSDPAGCGNLDPDPPIDGKWAAVDSDCAGPLPLDESLVSPSLNLATADGVTLQFQHYFNRYGSELADVDVRSARTGGAWVNVARFSADTPNPSAVTLDVSAQAARAADVQARWHYYGASYDWFWYVDNVKVSFTRIFSCSSVACPPQALDPPPISGLSASRGNSAGTRIILAHDASCAAPSTHLLYGSLGQVASYGLGGAVCSIPNPAVWDPVPPGNLWFLLVGASGSGVEGSWGHSSVGERNGLASSGMCGSTVKDLLGSCP